MIPGMGNMGNMMKQMKKLQKEMTETQNKLNEMTFEAASANDYVKVVVTGEKKIVDVKISEAVIDPEDPEMLEDMVLTAVNAALAKAEEANEQMMGKFTKGLPF